MKDEGLGLLRFLKESHGLLANLHESGVGWSGLTGTINGERVCTGLTTDLIACSLLTREVCPLKIG